MPLFTAGKTSQGRSKPKRSVLWLLLYTFQEGRPTDSDEGREVVQWRHLHVPSTSEMSVLKLTVSEDWTGCSCRRDHGDLLLGGLSYCIFFSLWSYIPFSLVFLFKRGSRPAKAHYCNMLGIFVTSW